MKKEYYQVVLEFSDKETKQLIQNEIKAYNDEAIISDEDIDKQYAVNELILAVLILIGADVAKNISKESVQWFFEYLKSTFKKRNRKNNENTTIEVTIKISDQKFKFIYDTLTEEYSVEKL